MRDWYVLADRLMAKYGAWAEKEFRRLRLTLPFDEINAMTAKARVDRLYALLDGEARKMFLRIAKAAYEEAYAEAAEGGVPESGLSEDWIDDFLLEYDPITKYVYSHEVDRKRARFFESIVSDAAARNRLGLSLDFRTAGSLWQKQIAQYAANAEDRAALQAYRDADARRVRWITEMDGRQCPVCEKRNRRIYPIDDIPPKPHYRCRCITIPVPGRGDEAD